MWRRTEYWWDSFWKTLTCEATNLMKVRAISPGGTLKWFVIVRVSVSVGTIGVEPCFASAGGLSLCSCDFCCPSLIWVCLKQWVQVWLIHQSGVVALMQLDSSRVTAYRLLPIYFVIFFELCPRCSFKLHASYILWYRELHPEVGSVICVAFWT
jgi:hypothetical protein